jgi:hypothetical protein
LANSSKKSQCDCGKNWVVPKSSVLLRAGCGHLRRDAVALDFADMPRVAGISMTSLHKACVRAGSANSLATTPGKISDAPFGFCDGGSTHHLLPLIRIVTDNAEPKYVTVVNL